MVLFLEPLDDGGIIDVDIKLAGEDKKTSGLSIMIFNSGDKLHKDYSSNRGGIGLSNVKSRLRIAYPDSLFKISGTESGGTLVEIIIHTPHGLEV